MGYLFFMIAASQTSEKAVVSTISEDSMFLHQFEIPGFNLSYAVLFS
jgi:hypothetical protein